jgi:hypothetical protein
MTRVRTQLCNDAGELLAALEPENAGCDAVVLLSLGLEPASLVPVARAAPSGTPVLWADCYGILGHSTAEGRNVELMEEGRGREYGGPGGDGGQGVVGVLFFGDVAVTTSEPPADAVAHLVVAAHGSGINGFLKEHATAIYYGGVAKATYIFDAGGERFSEVPHWLVSAGPSAAGSVGTTSFSDDASRAVRTLLDRAPAGAGVEAVGLFPCFMRGKNTYDANNVEPDAVSELLPGVPIYGMFCHGELGPRECMGFDPQASPQQSCTQHSMTSIVAIHLAGPERVAPGVPAYR